MLSLVSEGTAVICTSSGWVVPMVKLSEIFPNLSRPLTNRLVLVLLVLSVTAMVQLSYVPSKRVLNVTVLFPTEDELSELLQPPEYVMVPASVEEKV